MDKLLEIFRRLTIAAVWIGGGGLSLAMIIMTFSDGNSPSLTPSLTNEDCWRLGG